MRQGGRESRQIQSLAISAAAHGLVIIFAIIIPNWGSLHRPPTKLEHKIYTFDLIDPALLSMKMTSGGSTSTGKSSGAPSAKNVVKVKREAPKKKAEDKKKEEPRGKKAETKKGARADQPKKKSDAKKPSREKPVFSKKSMEERIKDQLKKIEEASGEAEDQWVEADKAEELFKPASQGKVEEQGIAGLLNTGDFNNINYNDAVASLIYQAWQPPSKTPTDKESVTVVVRFQIARDGGVSNPRVEKKSGSEVMDASAVQAIKDSSPLPPLPDDYSGESLEVCMTFVPVPEE